jgi:hypothetical protein
MSEKQVYAIFLMKAWQREFRPHEIFYDLNEAKNFLGKLRNEMQPRDSSFEWRLFRRTKTDWEKMLHE